MSTLKAIIHRDVFTDDDSNLSVKKALVEVVTHELELHDNHHVPDQAGVKADHVTRHGPDQASEQLEADRTWTDGGVIHF